jgi:transcriptional regulator of aromatic amino acid metabolism
VPRKSIRKKAVASLNLSERAQRLLLFGPPLLIQGEDGAAYDQLLARIWVAVNPVDIIDEMFIADIVFLEWEVLRWRRLKSSLIQARGLQALKDFLPRV